MRPSESRDRAAATALRRVGRSAFLFPALIWLAACGTTGEPQAVPTLPSGTARPAATPTRTPSPTPTPTPTATALPAVITGDPRALSLSEPIRQSGAPCGFVDTLDFPLDPPDGAAATGGSDFGHFRDRYDGYHTGEDWRLGVSSFGKPVYSVAHGQVTYAQPLGWGADKGVVIVQHVFRDGRRLLSFYGHLDPPSVTLRTGQCVERGEQIGAIGDPRTSPHLHFEIRVHLPDTPGPGYWSIDPRRAGWKPPSATIWFERMAALPGVAWAQSQDTGWWHPLGEIAGAALFASGEGELLALGADDGSARRADWLPETAGSALIDAGGALIYIASAEGVIQAYRASALENGSAGEGPMWSLDLEQQGMPMLAPLPDGGLIAFTRMGTLGISDQGEAQWSDGPIQGIISWATSGSNLIVLTRDRIWSSQGDRATSWPAAFSGRKIVASQGPFVYAEDGIYRLDLDTQSAELFYPLTPGRPRTGDLIELADGGLLVAHTDSADQRLIAIDPGGSLRWERSIEGLDPRMIQLLSVDGRAYLVTQADLGGSSRIDIWHVDPADGKLTLIFAGGARSLNPNLVDLASEGDMVVISIAGVGLFAWEPQRALEAVRADSD